MTETCQVRCCQRAVTYEVSSAAGVTLSFLLLFPEKKKIFPPSCCSGRSLEVDTRYVCLHTVFTGKPVSLRPAVCQHSDITLREGEGGLGGNGCVQQEATTLPVPVEELWSTEVQQRNLKVTDIRTKYGSAETAPSCCESKQPPCSYNTEPRTYLHFIGFI